MDAVTLWAAGQVNVGGVVSFTVTTNTQLALRLPLSKTEACTNVCPKGTREPVVTLNVVFLIPELSLAAKLLLQLLMRAPLLLVAGTLVFVHATAGGVVSFSTMYVTHVP